MRGARSKTSSEYRSSSGGNDSANSNTANNSRGRGGYRKKSNGPSLPTVRPLARRIPYHHNLALPRVKICISSSAGHCCVLMPTGIKSARSAVHLDLSYAQ
jgi:hypothetical protein